MEIPSLPPGTETRGLVLDRSCKSCGKPFKSPWSQVKTGCRGKYCSKVCVASAMNGRIVYAEPTVLGEKFVCSICGLGAVATERVLSSGRRRCVPCIRSLKRSEHSRYKRPVDQVAASVSLRKWKQRFPEKVNAHRQVEKAVLNGSLVKQPCADCGSTTRIHAHHEDYSRPLDVCWLCQKCHMARHRKELKPEELPL